MRVPDGSVIEGGERPTPRINRLESSEPNKPVWPIQIPKLPNHCYPKGLLGIDKFSIKELDERVALARVQGVLPQLDQVAA